jgi:hypothetical protein
MAELESKMLGPHFPLPCLPWKSQCSAVQCEASFGSVSLYGSSVVTNRSVQSVPWTMLRWPYMAWEGDSAEFHRDSRKFTHVFTQFTNVGGMINDDLTFSPYFFI